VTTRPRVLIYGFGPYRQFRDNITAKVIRILPRDPLLEKRIFRVRFDRLQFVRALARAKPDIVLGLGQSSRQKIEGETQARNRRRARAGDTPKPIAARGAARLKTTWLPRLGPGTGRSRNAGDYVCNFSMYVMLDHIRRRKLKIPYAFIHIPHDCDSKRAVSVVTKILRDVRARNNARRTKIKAKNVRADTVRAA
jgi:pyroglutamyl-peptidase